MSCFSLLFHVILFKWEERVFSSLDHVESNYMVFLFLRLIPNNTNITTKRPTPFFTKMPMTNVDNEHEQLVLMLNQLMNEREILSRENEYLKAKLNDSVLMETIREMRNERDLLFKLLSNLTMNNNKDEQLRYLKHYIKEK